MRWGGHAARWGLENPVLTRALSGLRLRVESNKRSGRSQQIYRRIDTSGCIFTPPFLFETICMSAGAGPLGRTGKRTLLETAYLQYRARLSARSPWRATCLPSQNRLRGLTVTLFRSERVRLFQTRSSGVARIRREQDPVITGWISEQIR